jgi:F-type H+-transporting ATPase subunit epsilon
MPVLVKICVPTKQIAELEAETVRIPSAQGNMGVLPNHAPLRCALEPGLVKCRLPGNKTSIFFVSTGLAIVENDVVTVLADSAERAEDIDLTRAEAARKRAEERVHTLDRKIDYTRAEAALKRALVRIQAASNLRH